MTRNLNNNNLEPPFTKPTIGHYIQNLLLWSHGPIINRYLDKPLLVPLDLISSFTLSYLYLGTLSLSLQSDFYLDVSHTNFHWEVFHHCSSVFMLLLHTMFLSKLKQNLLHCQQVTWLLPILISTICKPLYISFDLMEDQWDPQNPLPIYQRDHKRLCVVMEINLSWLVFPSYDIHDNGIHILGHLYGVFPIVPNLKNLIICLLG